MASLLRTLPEGPIRRSLWLSILEASLWSVMFGLAENFIVPFVLLFGATVFEVSLLQGSAQFSAGLGQLAGGALIQRGGSRRRLSSVTVAFHALGWLLTFGATVLTGSAWVAIGLYSAALFVANLGAPGWMSWMNELVPADRRGAFWSQRNAVAGIVQFLAIAAAGAVLYQAQRLDWEVGAYGVLFALAFLSRLGGAFVITRQHEPPMVRTEQGRQMTFLKFLGELRSSNFGRFVVFSILLTFATVMIYPIIQVYLLQELRLDYLQYSMVTTTFTIASFVFGMYWGPLGDRFGNRRILLVSALLLPFVAAGWVFVTDWRWMLLLQVVSGFVVAGVNMTTFNFIFDSVPADKLPKSAAYFTVLNTGFAFLGSVAGGALADAFKALQWHWGLLGPLTTVFVVTAVLRLLVLLLFARSFREVRTTEPSPGLRYFYIYKPYQDVTGWLQSFPRGLVRRFRGK